MAARAWVAFSCDVQARDPTPGWFRPCSISDPYSLYAVTARHRRSAYWTDSEHANLMRYNAVGFSLQGGGWGTENSALRSRADVPFQPAKSPIAGEGKTPVLHLAVETALCGLPERHWH